MFISFPVASNQISLERVLKDYWEETPVENETKQTYARRLEFNGHCEMFIRKALRAHFSMEIAEFSDFFEDFESARFRHLQKVVNLRVYPNERTLASKVSRNLGISVERAEDWLRRFNQTDFAK